jgi:hypothetical protein
MKRRTMKMSFKSYMKAVAAEAEVRRYRKYAEEKAKIPKHLAPGEYEAEVKRLARKYKI